MDSCNLHRAWPAAALILAIMIAGLSFVDQHGISYDEMHGVDVVPNNYDLIVNDISIEGPYRYDGTVFNFGAEALYQVYKRFVVSDAAEHKLETDMTAAFHARIQVRHLATFMVSMLAYACAAVMVGLLCGWRHAWLGPALLLMTPRFFGHSFFNFKDIPFAAVFTACSLYGAVLVNRLLATSGDGRRIVRGFAFYGLLVAILTGIRFGGLVHLAFPFAALVLMAVVTRQAVPIGRLAAGYATAIVCWLAGTILLYPYLWDNPLQGLPEMLEAMSDYPWTGTVLFNDEFVRAYDLPPTYLPVWLGITTPVLTLVAAICGLAWMMVRWLRMGSLQRTLVIFILLQTFLLPLMSIVGEATFYDGLRHFLFALVTLTVAAAAGLGWLLEAVRARTARALLASGIVVAYLPVAVDLFNLHPYEYTYFNRAFGGLPAADGRFETDYWGLSLRRGAEWVRRDAVDNPSVVVGGAVASVEPFIGETRRLVRLQDIELGKAALPEAPFYYIARPRWGLRDAFPECPEVFAVVRQQTPLAVVKRCGDDYSR